MKKNKQSKHKKTIERVLKKPSIINETKSGLLFIIDEPLVYQNRTCKQQSMSDILLGYHNRKGVPVEVKGTDLYRPKAIEQLHYGAELLNKLGFSTDYGRIVYYAIDKHKLINEVIKF